MSDWGKSGPVYVTRESADGFVGTFSMAFWLQMVLFAVVVANILGWGVYGLYALGDKII